MSVVALTPKAQARVAFHPEVNNPQSMGSTEAGAAGSLVSLGDRLFGQLSPYDGQGLKNHCLRLFRLTTLLMHRVDASPDGDLLYAISMIHDLGLVVTDVEGGHYMQRSLSLFERETSALGLSKAQRLLARECLLYNHRLQPVAGVSVAAECFRRAVWVEHTRGLKRYGLSREDVERVLTDYPRDNFDRVLLDFTRRVLSQEPLSLLRGIFR